MTTYSKHFYPILKRKAAYLHAEGISSSLYTLSKLKEVDQSVAQALLEAAANKDFSSLKYGKMAEFSINEFSDDQF